MPAAATTNSVDSSMPMIILPIVFGAWRSGVSLRAISARSSVRFTASSGSPATIQSHAVHSTGAISPPTMPAASLRRNGAW